MRVVGEGQALQVIKNIIAQVARDIFSRKRGQAPTQEGKCTFHEAEAEKSKAGHQQG